MRRETFDQLVPAADLVRHFGEWRDKANIGPIHISHHGRASHVLLSTEYFLKLLGGDAVPDPQSPLDTSQIDLLEYVGESVIIVDDQFVVRKVNRSAAQHRRQKAEDLIGLPLDTAFPTIRDSFVRRNIVRAVTDQEYFAADVPSPSGAWYRVKVTPLPIGAGIVYGDITGEVEAQRLADVKQSLLKAIEAHGDIGYARLSPRGFFEIADPAFCSMIELDSDTLQKTRFSNIVLQRHRATFNEAFESVFARKEPLTLQTELLSNTGSTVPVRLTLLQLRGEYAAEGVIALATREAPSPAHGTSGDAEEHQPHRHAA